MLDGPWGDDDTLRPNQIFAVSLPHSPLAPQVQAQVLKVVGRELLTSYGLRSLAPAHRDYRERYEGGVWERDGAYHQGPVWAFLLGHYALADHRVRGDAAAAQAWSVACTLEAWWRLEKAKRQARVPAINEQPAGRVAA